MTSDLPPAALDLLTPANVEELRVRAGEYEHPRHYVGSLIEKYSTHSLYTTTLHMATSLIEPFTNAADRRKLRGMRAAFMAGNLLAVEVVDITGGEELLDVLPDVTVRFNVPNEELTPSDVRKLVSAQLHLSGMETYQVATIFHPLIDMWSNKLAHRKHQESLRAGFGMILDMGKTAIDHYERRALEVAIENGVDWNEDMRMLLGEEG